MIPGLNQNESFSMALGELRAISGRTRLRIDRNQLVAYMVAIMEQ